jgi:hypothetical protein
MVCVDKFDDHLVQPGMPNPWRDREDGKAADLPRSLREG